MFADRVEITITDFGVGIENVEQAMQPFFTTKPDEERSGMGFTVMQAFTDEVVLESQPGKGTKLKLTKFFKDKEDIDAIYCAVPHNLHEQFYIDIIKSGKALLGEKPFGIDKKANENILKALAIRSPQKFLTEVPSALRMPGTF